MKCFIFPSHPLYDKKPDEQYEGQFNIAKKLGVQCSVFSMDTLSFHPKLNAGDEIVYLGWMLTIDEYQRLEASVLHYGCKLKTTTQQYKSTHYLPEWYSKLVDLTPATVYAETLEDIELPLSWAKFFVKDYVKSLTTSRGSVASTREEVVDIVEQLRKYRGKIEGGVCVREFEELWPETEQRFFVCDKVVYSRNDVHLNIVCEVAKRIDSPFYSVDVVCDKKRNWRVVEIGDGQVSEPKQWDLQTFFRMFFMS